MTVALNQPTAVAGTRVMGLGAYRPELVIDNEQICQWIDSSDEWIQQRTGIKTRHRAPRDVSVVDMAEGAAREALEHAGISGDELGGVIVATVTHPFATPSAAADLAHRLGATPAAAFDISAACAGYCYGIGQADAMVRSGLSPYVLVVGVEKLSDFIDNHERTISFLLGDGAGAAIIGPSEVPGISPSILGSNGEKWEAVAMDSTLLNFRDAVHAPARPRTPPSCSTRRTATGPRCARTAPPSSAGPSGRWRRSPSRRWTPQESPPMTSWPSSRTRRTCASSTRWSNS